MPITTRTMTHNGWSEASEAHLILEPDSDMKLKQLLMSGNEEEAAQAEIMFLLQHTFSDEELDRLLGGHSQIDVESWKVHSVCEEGYDEESPHVKNFWEVVFAMTPRDRSQLLSFVRGSSTVPADGFANLVFIIRRVSGGPDRLPGAHTCEFSLDLPEYDSKEQLETKLRRAMVEETFGQI
eukprot:TRINITY_DN19344_c0_g1_i1.p1 TRINITY_DN19344_c0_g1~~TRINITY_DN19344_c0_g1_i1.p1  ORF type:complete len:181 (+),score=23.99 TRINITY_DN19344_c0_g1_i1:437-979(+)